jgi:hypothetical protein
MKQKPYYCLRYSEMNKRNVIKHKRRKNNTNDISDYKFGDIDRFCLCQSL